MKDKRKIYVLAVFLFITSLFLVFVNIGFKMTGNVVLEEMDFPAHLTVGDGTGFDLNTTAFTFGEIAHGTSSTRKILLENSHDFPVRFDFSVEGDIGKFLVFPENIVLQPGEKKQTSITTLTLENQSHGDYFGKVIVRVRRAV